ncbi:MAG: aminodeoxychorismate synthase component I [Candidatus Halichondribacter symbioticus]
MKTPPPYLLFDAGFDAESANLHAAPRAFTSPKQIICAWQPNEVATAFATLQQAHDNGDWLAGVCAYELGYVLEDALHPYLPDNRRTPLLCFGVFDAPATPQQTQALLDTARDDSTNAQLSTPKPLWQAAQYRAAFDTAHAYICAGDFYQINLTFPMLADYTGSALGLYHALAAYQPVHYGALIDFTPAMPDMPIILSRSPELFFHLSANGDITTRPMKGTISRGQGPVADAFAANFLQNDIKNRAENLMIVDLLRNDLSQIADYHSVRVPELFTIETYETVHQMTSRISAHLRPNLTIHDIFAALFPCGSITGAPKIRAMRAIAELETAPRGAYCGSIGFIAPDGQMCFNVAIRTLSLYPDGEALLNVGGGVVYDSTADAEYEEALWKARYAILPQKG